MARRRLRRPLLATLAVLVTAFSLSTPAWSFPLIGSKTDQRAQFEKQCEDLRRKSSVRVWAEPSNIQYDFQRATRPVRAGSKVETTLGTAEAALSVHPLSTGTTVSVPSHGWFCLVPNLDLKFSVNPQAVWVGREFKQGTCAFNAIVEHELRHARTHQDYAEWAADSLQVELAKRYAGVVYYSQAEADRFKQELEQQWVSWAMQLFSSGAAEAIAVIDSPEEYARYETICNGEIPRVLRARHGR